MRILFLLTQDLESPSGLGRYRPLAEGLVQRGHQVRIAALHSNYDNLAEHRFTQNGVKVEYVAPMHVRKQGSQKTYYRSHELLWVSLRATYALARAALSDPGVEIVHIGKPHPMNSLAGLFAKNLLRSHPRLVLDRDDQEIGVNRFSGTWQRSLINLFETGMPRRVAHVTTNTFYTRNLLLESGIAPDKITYIPNGVTESRLAPPDTTTLTTLRHDLSLGDTPVVSYIGSMSLAGHPVDILLKAFPVVRQSIPDCRLLLVGGGEDLPNLQLLASELGIASVCTFTGRIAPEQVSLYYHLSSVTTDPVYDDEAARGRCPLKLFESWASGVPFVTADVGDRRRLLADPPAGLLANPGDPFSLAQALISILQNDGLAATLVENGRKKVQDYLWERLVVQLEQSYRQLSSPR